MRAPTRRPRSMTKVRTQPEILTHSCPPPGGGLGMKDRRAFGWNGGLSGRDYATQLS